MQHEDPCDECGLKFCRIQHKFTCDQCGSKFVSKSKLKYHDRMQHTLPCDECGYETIGELIRENDDLKLKIEEQDEEMTPLDISSLMQ